MTAEPVTGPHRAIQRTERATPPPLPTLPAPQEEAWQLGNEPDRPTTADIVQALRSARTRKTVQTGSNGLLAEFLDPLIECAGLYRSPKKWAQRTRRARGSTGWSAH